MDSSFKVTLLSLLTVGFSFLEEIEPCQFKIRNFSVTSSGVKGDVNLLLATLCFTLVQLFPLLNYNISSSPTRGSNCKHSSNSFILCWINLWTENVMSLCLHLLQEFNLGKANSFSRSLLVDFLCWPSTYFLAHISARTNFFHSTFSKNNLFGWCNTIWNKLVHSKTECDVSGPDCKIWTAQDPIRMLHFHHGPVNHIITLNNEASTRQKELHQDRTQKNVNTLAHKTHLPWDVQCFGTKGDISPCLGFFLISLCYFQL